MISIITPTYNSEETLRDTIESVLSQEGVALEYIIIDGGSTDGTLDIIRAYGGRIARVVSEPDQGLYDAMNKGICLATGAIVGILNSDDVYTGRDVLAAVQVTLDREHCDSVYADLDYVKRYRTNSVVRRWRSGAMSSAAIRWGWMPPHPTFFVRRHIYQQHGMYCPELRFSGDYELMLRFLYKYKISTCYLRRTIVNMRTGGLSNKSWKNRWQANREDRLAWRMNGLNPGIFTTLCKPLRKLGQFF
jgi:glycosyltransferase involved in cell wall biosynthesis